MSARGRLCASCPPAPFPHITSRRTPMRSCCCTLSALCSATVACTSWTAERPAPSTTDQPQPTRCWRCVASAPSLILQFCLPFSTLTLFSPCCLHVAPLIPPHPGLCQGRAAIYGAQPHRSQLCAREPVQDAVNSKRPEPFSHTRRAHAMSCHVYCHGVNEAWQRRCTIRSKARGGEKQCVRQASGLELAVDAAAVHRRVQAGGARHAGLALVLAKLLVEAVEGLGHCVCVGRKHAGQGGRGQTWWGEVRLCCCVLGAQPAQPDAAGARLSPASPVVTAGGHVDGVLRALSGAVALELVCKWGGA